MSAGRVFLIEKKKTSKANLVRIESGRLLRSAAHEMSRKRGTIDSKEILGGPSARRQCAIFSCGVPPLFYYYVFIDGTAAASARQFAVKADWKIFYIVRTGREGQFRCGAIWLPGQADPLCIFILFF